ncbi:MAG: clostripain-related cysteine peptidase [Candidatus Eremiobacteraeota bacterium]|nr:clostripain-related cysteine peptidase [Candidatus Eremiobacteraeota bacterium]
MDNSLNPLSSGTPAFQHLPASPGKTAESRDRSAAGEERAGDTFEKSSPRSEKKVKREQHAPSEKKSGEKEYTILAYMDGCNNLEDYILQDLKEMEGCPSDNYNLVVQLSRFQTKPLTVLFMAEALSQAFKSPEFKESLRQLLPDSDLISEYSQHFKDPETCRSISSILLQKNPGLNDKLDELVSGKVKEAAGQSRAVGDLLNGTVAEILKGVAVNEKEKEKSEEAEDKKSSSPGAPVSISTLGSSGPSLIELLGDELGQKKETDVASDFLKATADFIRGSGEKGSVGLFSGAGAQAPAGGNVFFVESPGREGAKITQGDYSEVISESGGREANTEPAWRGVRRYKVEHHRDSTKIHSPVLNDLGHVDMSSGKTLADFLTWGIKNYPAKHYIVIFSDHGAGFMGAEEDRGAMMSMPAIREALEKVKEQTGKKPDIIAFDACFMGQAEVANELKDSGKYLIASEEVIGGDGYPYSAILPRIDESIAEGKTDPKDMAKIIMEEAEGANESATMTLSTLDLGAIGKVMSAANDLAKDILAGKADIDDVRDSLRYTQHYDHYTPGPGPYSDFRDLWDLADCIENNPNIKNRDIKKDVAELKKAIEASVVFEQHNDDENYERSHGMSIYAPRREDSVDEALFSQYDELSISKHTKWNELIKELTNYDGSEGDAGERKSKLTFIPLRRRV